MTRLEEHFATALEEEAKLQAHCQGFMQGILTHAKRVGAALQEAYKIVKRDKRCTWEEAVNKYFNASRRTADIYRHIHKNWKRLEQAIESGEIKPSIAAALEFLSRPRKRGNGHKPIPESKPKDYRTIALDKAEELMVKKRCQLDPVEREKLINCFEDFWNNGFQPIKNAIRFDDPYYYEDRDNWDLAWDYWPPRDAEQRAADLHRITALRSQRIIKRVKLPRWPGDIQRYELQWCE